MDRMVIIGIVIVVALLLIGIAAYFMLSGSSTSSTPPATSQSQVPQTKVDDGTIATVFTGQYYTGRAIPLYIAKTYNIADLKLNTGEEIGSVKPKYGWGVTGYVPSGSVKWTTATNGITADANNENDAKGIPSFGDWTNISSIRVYRETW